MAGVSTATQARRIELTGHVQGVGFRPFVFRLAHEYRLSGWVQNQLGQVAVLVQGTPAAIEAFAQDLVARAPPMAAPRIIADEPVTPTDFAAFSIVESSATSQARIFVPADRFACADCLREMADAADRRYRYPFTNCTNCGPRYTLITAMPYDRPNTTLASFPLCDDCDAEYRDLNDRRFHAEPVACPACGPALSYADGVERKGGSNAVALAAAVAALAAGQVVAVKGIGGYHLMCDAGSDRAVTRLRTRKQRPHKPLAVMFPAAGEDGLDMVRQAVHLSPAEAAAVESPLRPIVLALRRADCALSAHLAPGLAELGVFLPYSPLHQLILNDFGAPLVATSGNLSGEPVLTDNDEAGRRLAAIADAFLHHNRPIQRPADDSVFRTSGGRPRPLRLGRGAAPLELMLPAPVVEPLLAVGGQMKGAIALAWGQRIVVSPHIGEMDTPRSLEVFESVVADLQTLYGVSAARVVCDAHPGYSTHRWAKRSGLPVVAVPHHHAHASALVGEHPSAEPLMVFTWDGVGLGSDGTLWGGETLIGTAGRWQRIVSMRPFFLPGGERVGREPWRSAAALCWEVGRGCPAGPADTGLTRAAWQRRLNAPQSSAVGRLFDAAAALVLGLDGVSHEAQGPMELEAVAGERGTPIALPIQFTATDVARVDWSPLLALLLDDSLSVAQRAADFHSSLARNLLDQARLIRDRHAIERVGLGGGVFQNRRLVAEAQELLSGDGFTLLLAEQVPCNDGGLSFGQVVEAAALSSRPSVDVGRSASG
jgi:hydrogenase maturation protein HypF